MILVDQIVDWLKAFATQARAQGYVFGLSGGIDSACTAGLCQRAMGDQVLAVYMACHSSAEDEQMARLVAAVFGLELLTVDLGPTYDSLVATLPRQTTHLARANLKPRLRMATLYALAQTHGYLVAGTGNKSEILVGYYTKYGDGGVDLEPLGGLFKFQVRQLARELGVPQAVINRPPTAGLWVGQTDEEELGITYDALDSALAALEAGQTQGVDPDVLARVQRMIAASAHKRTMPPVCPVEV